MSEESDTILCLDVGKVDFGGVLEGGYEASSDEGEY